METEPGRPDGIRFKPLTEGLGINHFADGLPYSPASKSLKNQRPTRAAAGTPPPVMRATMPNGDFDLARLTSAVEAAVAAREGAADAEASAHSVPLPAGWGRRSLAFAADMLLLSVLFGTIILSAFRFNGFDFPAIIAGPQAAQILLPLGLFYVVFYFGYFLVQEVSWGRTVGKALFGARIQYRSPLAALGRAFCFPVSTLPLGIGLLWYFFDARRRCWHDVICDTDVVVG